MTDYNDEWEQLDEKTVLVQILAELQRLNQTLGDAEDAAHSDRTEPDGYRCRKCQETLSADARTAHARDAHKAPPDMVDAMFVSVE